MGDGLAVSEFAKQPLNRSTSVTSQVGKVDPVPVSSLKATQYSNNNPTQLISQVGKADPVPASSPKVTNPQIDYSTTRSL